MNASSAQILTLENYKAHLQSVKVELESVSSDLASLLQKKDDAEKEYSSVLSQTEKLQNVRGLLQQANDDLSQTIRDRVQQVYELDNEISDKKEEFSDQEEALKKIGIEFVVSCSAFNEVKAKFESEAKSAEAQRDMTKAFLASENEQYERRKKDVYAIKDFHERAIGDHAEFKAKRQQEIVQLQKKISNLQDQLIEEQQRSGSTERNLAEREQRIKNTEDNIQIIQSRIIEIWADKFPGMSAPRI